MSITIKEFVNELSKSDLMEHPIYQCGLSCLFQNHPINIIPVESGYNVVTSKGTILIGDSLANVGTRIMEYTNIKNGIGIIDKLADSLVQYGQCNATADAIRFKGFTLRLEDESIVTETTEGDKFYFNITNTPLDFELLAEKINRFLK